jgi:hypothetical protein
MSISFGSFPRSGTPRRFLCKEWQSKNKQGKKMRKTS